MYLIYIVLISIIFTIIAIIRSKNYEYKKSFSIALIIYSIIIRFMLLDVGSDSNGNLIFSGGIILSNHSATILTVITYLGMIIGMEILLFSIARR